MLIEQTIGQPEPQGQLAIIGNGGYTELAAEKVEEMRELVAMRVLHDLPDVQRDRLSSMLSEPAYRTAPMTG